MLTDLLILLILVSIAGVLAGVMQLLHSAYPLIRWGLCDRCMTRKNVGWKAIDDHDDPHGLRYRFVCDKCKNVWWKE